MTPSLTQALKVGPAMKVESLLAALAFRIVEVGLRDPRAGFDPVEVNCHCECDCDADAPWLLLSILCGSLLLNLGQFFVRRPAVTPPDGSPSRYTRGVVVMPARRSVD